MRRIFVFAISAVLLLAPAALSVAGESRPIASVCCYSFETEAAITAAPDGIALPGFGFLEIRSETPVVELRLDLSLEKRGWPNARVWVESGVPLGAGWTLPERLVVLWEGSVERDAPQRLSLKLKLAPASSLRISVAGPHPRWPGKTLLGDGVLVFQDGTSQPLAAAFGRGYETLKPPAVYGPESLPEPPTKRLAPRAAEAAIEADWLAQLGSLSFAEGAREEFARTERILHRLSTRLTPSAIKRWGKRLAAYREQIDGGTPRSADILYRDLRRMKRELLLSDPEIDFSAVLCIDNPYPHGEESAHEIRHRNESAATPGGRLLVVGGLRPDAEVKKLAPEGAPASFWRPDLSYDAKRVVFCMKPANESAFHLYEIGVDGGGFRQLTRGDYNDLDPIHAPDGGIIFTTSRCNHYLRCGGSFWRNFILARCDGDGRNIYFISTNVEADYTPTFLPDGRVLYTRWEYVDKEVFHLQSLWTVNPDGTGASTFWGNQSCWPDMLGQAQPIPGTQKVLFVANGHHHVFDGPLGVLDPREGINYPDGVYNLTPHVPWAEVGEGPADRSYNDRFHAPPCYKAFQTPYPISSDLMLVSARKGKLQKTRSYWPDPDPAWFQLYLMDYDGNMELLYRGAYNIFHAQPIRCRAKPRTIPSHVQWPGKIQTPQDQPDQAVFNNPDVYENSGIPRGMVKFLRVLEVESQTYGDGDHSGPREKKIFSGDVPPLGQYTLWAETPSSLVYDEGIKRVLGTVPVEEDGSVHFKVPPVRSLFFQLLDEKGRCLQTMRSATHGMPGETRGCVGCHETRPVTPPVWSSVPLAMKRAPSKLEEPPWGDETVGFARFVQPILDAHCTRCHGGPEPDGGLDFSHRTVEGTLFTRAYVTLLFGKGSKTTEDLPRTSIAGPLFPYVLYPASATEPFPTTDSVVPPMTALSHRSRLIEIATGGKHYDVRISPDEEARLVTWVDANCPFLGMEEVLALPDASEEAYYTYSGTGKYSHEHGYDHRGLSFAPRMRTAPAVHKAFRQDEFNTQSDRLPKDRHGNVLPSMTVKDGKRTYRLP